MRSELAIALVICTTSVVHAQERTIGPERCTVQIVNQVVPVGHDAGWTLTNIPSNTGFVRARLYCNGPFGETRGESELLDVLPNQMIALPSIMPGPIHPGPTRVVTTVADDTLEAVDATTQVIATGLFADRTSRVLTGPEEGTSYATSNDGIASVDPQGVLTAHRSGTVIVTAWNAGMPGTAMVHVVIGGDRDEDGLPDDYEILVGLNPRDPLDALGDSDGDGLTNLEEFQAGSHPFKVDSDGDTVADGEEVRSGKDGFVTSPILGDSDGDLLPDDIEIAIGGNPVDVSDARWTLALSGLEARPGAIFGNVGPLSDGSTRRVRVLAELLGRQKVDVTAHASTLYTIDNPGIASSTPSPGEIDIVSGGSTTLHVAFFSYGVDVPIDVGQAQPFAIQSIALPCDGRDVALVGRLAYVSCDTPALFVADVLAPPEQVAQGKVFLGASATDIDRDDARGRLVMTLENGDVVILDRSVMPPTVVATVNVGYYASSVAVSGDLALVGRGNFGGFAVIDLTGTPTLRGQVDTLTVTGVGLGGTVGTVLDNFGGVVQLVDLSDPDAPILRGQLTLQAGPQSAVIDGGYAYVALYSFFQFQNGLATIDLSDLDDPSVTAIGTQSAFILRDVAKNGDLLLGADVFRQNSLAVIDTVNPANPQLQAFVDFPGDLNALGIDASNDVVVATAGPSFDHATTLLVGRYRTPTTPSGVEPPVGLGTLLPPAPGANDFVKPTVRVIDPPTDIQHYVDEPLTIEGFASDDSGVLAKVEIIQDTNVAATLRQPPWVLNLPAGSLELGLHTFVVQATDLGGNVGRTFSRVVSIVEPPKTRAFGRVMDTNGLPVASARVEVVDQGMSVLTLSDGTFSLSGIRAVDPFELTVQSAAGTVSFGPYTATGDDTDVGDLLIEAGLTGNERLVGPVVAVPVPVSVAALTLPPGATTFRDALDDDHNLQQPSFNQAHYGPYDGALIGTFVYTPRGGSGSEGALVVPDGETVTLPGGVHELTSLTVHGTLVLEDEAFMLVQGDVSGTGEIQTGVRGAHFIIGGQLDLTVDPLNPTKPSGIHAAGNLDMYLGTETPGPSICEPSITAALEETSDFYPTVGQIYIESFGDFLMSEEAMIGGVSNTRSGSAMGGIVMKVEGDLVTGTIQVGPSSHPYASGGVYNIAASGDVEVTTFTTLGGVGYANGSNTIIAGGDLVAQSIASGDSTGLSVIVGGSAAVGELHTGDVYPDYVGTGDIFVSVESDFDVGAMTTGSFLGIGPPGDLGSIEVQAGGTFTFDTIEVGERPSYAYNSGEVSLDAARIENHGGYVLQTDEYGQTGSIFMRADELRLDQTRLVIADNSPSFDGVESFTSTGDIFLMARIIDIQGGELVTGDTNYSSGDIYILAEDTAWLDGVSIHTGDVPCPDDENAFVRGSGDIYLEAGATIVLDDGPTEIYTGTPFNGTCAPSPGYMALNAGERVRVDQADPDGISVGAPLGQSPAIAPDIQEGAYVQNPDRPVRPRGFQNYVYDSSKTYQSVAIDLGSEMKLVAADIDRLRAPVGGFARVRFATTNQPDCSLLDFSEDVDELLPARWVVFEVELQGRWGAHAAVDAIEVSYVPYVCAPNDSCDDQNPCTFDSCGQDGVCVHETNPDPFCDSCYIFVGD